MNSFYTKEELIGIGFLEIGEDVLISRKCSIYSPHKICIGNNVRIDDFCILSGNIRIGSNIHISAYCALYGAFGIELEDYTGISPRSIIFSASDDFSGDYLIGPVHNSLYTNVTGGKVTLKKYSQLGANTVVFPGVTVNEGAVTGAMTLVTKDLSEWTINTGIPVNKIRKRSKKLLTLV